MNDINLGVLPNMTGHKDYVRSIAFSPDGKVLVSGSDDLSLRIWEVETSLEIKKIDGQQKACIRSVSFSKDGEFIASGSDDKTILVWEWRKGIKHQ